MRFLKEQQDYGSSPECPVESHKRKNDRTRQGERDIKMAGGYVTVLTDLSMCMPQ